MIEEELKIDCPRCGNHRTMGKRLINATPMCWICEASVIFLAKARRQWGNRFDYSKEEQAPLFFDLYLKCNVCNSEFKTKPSSHLDQPYGGCKECKRLERASSFIAEAAAKHGEGRYIYDLDNYKALNKPITVSCLYHGAFTTLPKNHIRGQGCPDCVPTIANGWSKTDFVERCKYNNRGRASFYVITCYSPLPEAHRYYEKPFVKVGITSKQIKERFRPNAMPYHIEPILVLEGDAGEVYDLEKTMLKVNKLLKYEPFIPFGGQTECFTSLTLEAKKILNLVE